MTSQRLLKNRLLRSYDSDGKLWTVSNNHSVPLSILTVFEQGLTDDDVKVVEKMVRFTVFPTFHISSSLQAAQPPPELYSDCLHILQTYVSQVAFWGSNKTMGAPPDKLLKAHSFLREVSMIGCAPNATTSDDFQLTEIFAPCLDIEECIAKQTCHKLPV